MTLADPIARTAAPAKGGPGPATMEMGGEVPFGFEEIFFSRTDPRGVIQAGNATFQRVSGLAWDRLVGAPHKVVRHPAMPRGLFHLLWERLKAGQPTGAYVRNRADDGRSYWVFAVVVPVGDGYLSVRIKPGSDRFHAAQLAYAEVLRAEAEGASPAQGAALLTEALEPGDGDGYDAAQANAIEAETAHRAAMTGRPRAAAVDGFALARDAIRRIEGDLRGIQGLFEDARLVSTNLRVLASSLGDLGKPVSVISSNYAMLAHDMSQWLETRMLDPRRGLPGARRAVMEGLFLSAAAEVLGEMSQDFARRPGTAAEAGAEAAAEARRLQDAAAGFRTRSVEAVPRVAASAQALAGHLLEMRRHVTGLSSVRMLCRVEGAALGAHGGSLDRIVDQLNRHQDRLEGCLLRIADGNLDLQRSAVGLRASRQGDQG